MQGLSSVARTVYWQTDFCNRRFLRSKDSPANSLIRSPHSALQILLRIVILEETFNFPSSLNMSKNPSSSEEPFESGTTVQIGKGIRIVGMGSANGTSEAESPTSCKKGSKIAAILLGERGRIHRTMGLSNFQFSLLTFPFQSLERKKSLFCAEVLSIFFQQSR